MERKEAKVQKYLLGRAGGEIDVFDLMYETSLPYPEAKAVLDQYAAESKVEAIGCRTYRLLGEGWRSPKDEAEWGTLGEEERRARLERRKEERRRQAEDVLAEDASAEDTQRAEDVGETSDEAELLRRRREYLERRRMELIRRIQMEDEEDDDCREDEEDDDCREDTGAAGYDDDDDDNDSELKTKLRTLMADASPEGKDKLSIVRYAVEHGSVTVQILIHELGFSEKNAREMIRKLNAEGILGNRGKTSYPSLISYDLYIECRAAQENSENKREQTDPNDPDDVDTEDGRGEDGKDASGEENAASDDFEEKVRVCLKALIYDDLTLSRTKALLKARGALFVANRIGAEGIISIYDAIVQALDCMTDYQFLRLRTQLSSGE